MKCLYTLLIFIQITLIHAQESSFDRLMLTDSTWRKEIIPFPIDWAPKLTLDGYEELSFTPNWSDANHDEFWTLIMAWYIETETEIPLYELQFNLNHYFYALMIPNHWAQEFPDPILEFEKISSKENLHTQGKLKVFDGFHTGEVINLNISMEQQFCEDKKNAIIIFRISPKSRDHNIWKTLKAIKSLSSPCN